MARKSKTKSKTPLILTPLKSPPIFPHLTVPQPVHGESTRSESWKFHHTLEQLREPLLFAPYEIPSPSQAEAKAKNLLISRARSFEHPELLPYVFHFNDHEDPDCNAEINYELLRRESIQSRVSVPIIDTARCADELLRQGYVDDALFLYEKSGGRYEETDSSGFRMPEYSGQRLLEDISDDNRRREVLVQLWLASKDMSILSQSLGFSGHPYLGLLNEGNETNSLMSLGEKGVLNGFPPEGVMLYRGSWGFELGKPRGMSNVPTPARTWTNDSDRAHEDAEEARRAASAEYRGPLVPKIEKVRVERDDIALLFLSDPGFVAILKPNCRKKPRAYTVK